MDGLLALGVLAFFGVIIGALLGLVSFFELRGLRSELNQLREQLRQLRTQVAPLNTATSVEQPPAADAKEKPAPDTVRQSQTRVAPTTVPQSQSVAAKQTARKTASAQTPQPPLRYRKPAPAGTDFWQRLQENWMVWLGGGCVALSGIFLARYGMEQGLLGPKVRIALGLCTALALYIAAEWLRRKTGSSHPTFAALAGGGAITAFAAVLSAVHLYQLISPGFAFALLALVAVITMWMARLHGPVLAAIGMLGAYSVPLLVSSGSGNVLAVFVYCLIISLAVLLLLRHVYRTWLWLGLLAGSLGWWLISLLGDQADGWRGVYLAALGYGLLAVVSGDWLLRGALAGEAKSEAGEGVDQKVPAAGLAAVCSRIEPLLLPSMLLLVIAQCLSMLKVGFGSSALATLASWSPLAILLLVAARNRAALAFMPWLLLLGQSVVWLVSRLQSRLDFERGAGEQVYLQMWPAEQQGPFLTYLTVTVLLFSGMALLNLRRGLAQFWWASLAVMAPLLGLVLGYLLAGDYLPAYLWSLYAAILGAVFLYLGSCGVGKFWPKAMVVWLFAAGHFGYSLAVCLWLEQASLTLALAIQAVSLAWIIRRFDVPALGWLLKGVLLLVVVRLTLNPWLLSYTLETHWSLWTYGGATLSAWFASRLLAARPQLARWAEAAALHLLVLTLWAESRYWLYDGNAFARQFSFAEAVINIWLFAGLGLVYYRKSLLSGSFARWYDSYGRLLMLAAVANYAYILLATAASNSWAWGAIGSTPVFNLLLPAFAGPALLAALVSRYYLPEMRKLASLLAAAAGFIWISLEIRHLWQGNIRLDTFTGTGELYTYSVVWLICAVAAILLGSWRGGGANGIYRGGMAVLALVIVKLFMVDMSDLEGLLRVASFMGLGLALLGIAYLHQRMNPAKQLAH